MKLIEEYTDHAEENGLTSASYILPIKKYREVKIHIRSLMLVPKDDGSRRNYLKIQNRGIELIFTAFRPKPTAGMLVKCPNCGQEMIAMPGNIKSDLDGHYVETFCCSEKPNRIRL